MSISLQEALQICKEEYPDLRPYAYVETEKEFVFNLILKRMDPERAIADFHRVDKKNGEISGAMNTMILMKDKSFRDAWQKATLVKVNDDGGGGSGLEHSGFFRDPSGLTGGPGWGVRVKSQKTTNGRMPGYDSFGNSSWDTRVNGQKITDGGTLIHHGIKNQQWGVQNGPPYPLDRKLSAAIRSGKNPAAQNGGGETKGLSYEDQEILKKGAVKIGAGVLAVAAYSFVSGVVGRTIKRIKQNKNTKQSKELNDALIGDIAEHKDYGPNEHPKMIQGKHSIEDDMAAVNPKYAGSAVPGTTNNCSLCSFTYELRRRGYDVTAKPSLVGNYNDVLMVDMYEGARADKIGGRDWNDLYSNVVKKYPEGSRGVMGAWGLFGGGHAMAWEIHNGKLEIIDGQRNVRSSPEEMQACLYKSNEAQFIRLDHLKVKEKEISRVCSELKDDWKKTVKNLNREKATSGKANDGLQSDDKDVFEKPKKKKAMTKQEKRQALEKVWKEEHKNTYIDDNARESMKRWVDANMWSMYGHEGAVLVHNDRPDDFFMHYGIKNQKWGVRRFQNEDRTLTEAGKERYRKDSKDEDRKKRDKSMTGMNRDGEPVKAEKSGSSKWKANEAEELSEAELDRRNRRLQKEKQYRDLTTPQWKKDAANVWKEALKAVLITAATTPLAVVMGKKYKYLFAKGRDFLHRIAGKPLPHPTNPNTFFEKGQK